MKKFIVLFILFCVVLAFTNPSRSEYAKWQSTRLKDNRDQIISEKLVNWIDVKVIDNRTSVVDYKLFTLFETKFTELGKEPIKAVGIVTVFIPIPRHIDIYGPSEVISDVMAFVVLILSMFLALRLVRFFVARNKKKQSEDLEI